MDIFLRNGATRVYYSRLHAFEQLVQVQRIQNGRQEIHLPPGAAHLRIMRYSLRSLSLFVPSSGLKLLFEEGEILYTLELRHPTFDKPARIVRWPVTSNEPEKFSLKLENTAPENPNEFVDFIAVPFEVTLPAQEENAPGEFKLKIENVGGILTQSLTFAVKQRDPVRIIFREYLKHIPEYPQLVYTDFSISKATVNMGNVEGTASMIDWLLRQGGEVYTPSDWPGLVRGR